MIHTYMNIYIYLWECCLTGQSPMCVGPSVTCPTDMMCMMSTRMRSAYLTRAKAKLRVGQFQYAMASTTDPFHKQGGSLKHKGE